MYPRLSAPHLADLIKAAGIQRIAYHRIQPRQLIQEPRLREKVITPQQLATAIGAQPQRPPQREPRQPQIIRAEAGPSFYRSEEDPAAAHRNKVRHRGLPLRIPA